MARSSVLRVPAADLLDRETLAALRQRSALMGVSLVFHAWVIIGSAMALFFFFPNPLTFILAVMIIGARQLGLAVLMHDAAHNALMPHRKLNEFVSDFFCAYPLLARTDSYRRYHLQHHMRTQQPEDPDLILSAPFPITRKSFTRKMIRDLTGQTAYQQRKAQFASALGGKELSWQERGLHFWQRLGPAMIANFVILVLCSVLFHWSFYLMFWLLPFFTYHMAITRIRNIAEHAVVPDNDDPFRNARTTKAGWLARLFLAPYWVNYHVEHHLLMYVPCWQLPATHRALRANGLAERMETAPGYLSVLRQACTRRDDEDKRGDLVHNARRRVAGNFTEGFTSNAS